MSERPIEEMAPEELQALLTRAVKVYAARAETQEGGRVPPIDAEALTATDVVVAVSDMIRAMDLNLFDLAMWFRRPLPEFDAAEAGGRHG